MGGLEKLGLKLQNPGKLGLKVKNLGHKVKNLGHKVKRV